MFVDKIDLNNSENYCLVFKGNDELYRVPTMQEIIDAYHNEYLCFTAMENNAKLQLVTTKASETGFAYLSNDGQNWWKYTLDDDPTYSDYRWYYEIQVNKGVKMYFKTDLSSSQGNLRMWFNGNGKWNISGNINKSIPTALFNNSPTVFQGREGRYSSQVEAITPNNNKYLLLPYDNSNYPISRYNNIFSSTQISNMLSTPTYWNLDNNSRDDNCIKLTSLVGTSTIGLAKLATGQTISYRYTNSSSITGWNTMTTATTISITRGNAVFLRGTLSSNNTTSNYTQFTMSGNVKASGNINYLWNYQNTNDNLKDYCGYGLFSGITALSDVSELELPATALTTSCYNGMLRGTSITVAPQLPATTLVDHCYESMFKGCPHLTTAPSLPATVLTTSCYQSLFSECTSLINPPTLPATRLAPSCYREMFNGCTSLVSAPELPATTLAIQCYYRMFRGCTSLTTAPSILPATTLADYCYYSMFASCTSLTTAPELPAPTLVLQCYRYMFDGCSNLNYIKCLATNISATNCTTNWVANVASAGTFVKDASMTGWTTGNNGIPTNWTVEDNPDLPDLTKKHWWTATNGIYNFKLPTRWNNGYRVEVDQYFTGSGNTSSCGSIFRQNSNNSPLEVFYTGGFYFDAHYPNSTTSPTVNTTDYDHRVSLGRTTFNNTVQPNVKYTFKYEMTPTHAIRIYNGSTLVYQTTYNSGNKNWCTTGDYSLYAASMAARSGWCVVSDIRVYDNNNTLIHNFQLYPSPNPDVLGYEYLDIVTNTWYPVVNGEIRKVETTDR